MVVALASGWRVQSLAAVKLSNLWAGAEKLIFSFDRMVNTTRLDASHMFDIFRLEDPALCPVSCLES